MPLDPESFELLTFDCYGTLIDWESGILTALGGILAAHGAEVSERTLLEAYAELESEAEAPPYLTYREVLARVVDGLGLRLGFTPTPEDRAALASSIQDWPPFPDTREALRRLAGSYKLAIISNVDDDLFEGSARRIGVPFDWVVTAMRARAYKPDLKVFRVALEEFRIPREKILHVAQSLYHDIAPARTLGLATVWVNRRRGKPGAGATPRAAATPDMEVADLAELARALSVRSS